MTHRIQNFDALAANDPWRTKALEIVEAGLQAIDTKSAVMHAVNVHDSFLTINGHTFDLSAFDRIRVFGFGKAALDATLALEAILGSRITDGAVIDVREGQTQYVKSFKGSHPRPSLENVVAAEEILAMAQNSTERDLVLTVVSGGGSSLLCSTAHECIDSTILYDAFLASGGTIEELNTIRKHISHIKGGGFAKAFYPATIVGLIFCDVPGSCFSEVASGPTFMDSTDIQAATSLLEKYQIHVDLHLVETPKDARYFERVHNIGIVSNETALDAMKQAAVAKGLTAEIISHKLFETVPKTVEAMKTAATRADVILAGGEVRLEMAHTPTNGCGGRNSYLAAAAIPLLEPQHLFVSIASDGIDNCPEAGALVDSTVVDAVRASGTAYDDYMNHFDSENLFKPFNNLLVTGPTGANVADLMMLITKK